MGIACAPIAIWGLMYSQSKDLPSLDQNSDFWIFSTRANTLIDSEGPWNRWVYHIWLCMLVSRPACALCPSQKWVCCWRYYTMVASKLIFACKALLPVSLSDVISRTTQTTCTVHKMCLWIVVIQLLYGAPGTMTQCDYNDGAITTCVGSMCQLFNWTADTE